MSTIVVNGLEIGKISVNSKSLHLIGSFLPLMPQFNIYTFEEFDNAM